ncbi:PQQ-binding-like beta-propeller repeat protein [Candidatus Micrarchaeota archaeon]|nr:PQQ-binding-like beta-propeller repeat protein [Candidatus Micrarchaeota archaeon]
MKARLFCIALVFSVFFLASVTALYLPINRERAEMLKSPCLAKPWLCRFLHDPPSQYVNAPAITSPVNASYENSSQPLSLEFVAIGSFSGYSIQVFVDGSLTESGAISNNSLYSRALPVLSPGSHAVEVRAFNGSKSNSSRIVFSVEGGREDGWTSFHGGWDKTGFAFSFAPDNVSWAPNDVMTAWILDTDYGVASSPVVWNGTVFVGSLDGKVYAADAVTGARKWVFDAGSAVWSTPAVSGGRLFFGTAGGALYSVDAVSGARNWVFNATKPIHSSPTVSGNLVFFTARDGFAYAVNASSSELLWSTRIWTPSMVSGIYDDSPWPDSSPLVAYGKVFVGSYDRNLYALDELTGVVQWRFAAASSVRSTASTDGDGCFSDCPVFFGSDDGFVYRVSSLTGAEHWRFRRGVGVSSSPALAGGLLVFGDYDGSVYAVDKNTGLLSWNFSTGGIVLSSPAVAQGVVFVGSDDNYFYALDLVSGRLKWRYAAESWVTSSPAVYDGLVVVGSLDSKVYAFGGLSECRSLLLSGSPSEKADVVIVSDNYDNDLREPFFSDASDAVFGSRGLFSVVPLSNNTAKFNVYALYSGGSGYWINHQPWMSELIRSKCAGLNGSSAELVVDFYNNEEVNNPPCAGGGDLFLKSRYRGTYPNPFFWDAIKADFVHEFGHTALGGSNYDEYITLRAAGANFTDIFAKVNVDMEGCPTWCSGEMNRTVRVAADYSNKTCYYYYSAIKSCLLAGTDPVECWRADLMYGDVAEECDFGVGCRPGTGCYWTAGDLLLFRSTAASAMRLAGSAEYFSLLQREALLAALEPFTPATTSYVLPYCGNKASPLPCVNWTAGADFREGQVLAEFRAGVSLASATSIIRAANASVLDSSLWAAQRRLVASVVRGSEAKLSWLLEKDARVTFAEPNR